MDVELDLERGMAALHDTLVQAIRSHRERQPSAVNGVASALSLLLFGHNGILEGIVRDAARRAANGFTPAATDADIIALFLSGLPVAWCDMPVRDRFFAERYRAQAADARLAHLLAEYERATEYDPDAMRGDDAHAGKAVTFMEHLLQSPLAQHIRQGAAQPAR